MSLLQRDLKPQRKSGPRLDCDDASVLVRNAVESDYLIRVRLTSLIFDHQ
jgi:hypothetical protein